MGNHFSFKKAVAHTAVVVALGLGSASLHAASNVNGVIAGDVSVGNATVTVTNESTGLTRTVRTDVDGEYLFPALPVGSYKVTVSKDGYQSYTQNVTVAIGTRADIDVDLVEEGVETVTVTSGRIRLDTTTAESALNITEAEVDVLPVGRNITAVSLLAPGTLQGDSAFGNLPSFGGATVGENAYYINGFNVTNFRNGLGGSTIPFEFYEAFQVKTGGYSAEFGRSTGGVVNAVTKSGTNEFEWGVDFFWEPDSLRDRRKDIVRPSDGTVLTDNSRDEDDFTNAVIHASGAIVEDTLFFYALYNPRDNETQDLVSGGSQIQTGTNDDAFWGAKIDWQLSANHLVEYTGFSDGSSSQFVTTDLDGSNPRVAFQNAGGDNHILSYNGQFGDLGVRALYGQSEYDRTAYSALDNNPLIIDIRGGVRRDLGNWANGLVGTSSDEKDAFRLDFDWYLGDHQLRFGFDEENYTASDLQQYSGGVYWLYNDDAGSSTGENVRERFYFNGGDFDTKSRALYIEDIWSLGDVTLTLGLRNEYFDNKNANGNTFTKIDDQLAPRLGMAWDINGDGSAKLFANYGRYHLPVATNTNVRLAGSEFFTEQFFELNGLNADDSPIKGPALGPVSVFGNGEVADERAIVNQNLDPMYQDEYSVGYEMAFENNVTAGIQFIHRDLKSTLEDVAIDAAVLDWAEENGMTQTVDGEDPEDVWTGFHQYVLTNPGQDMRIYLPEFEQFADLSAEQLGYPESERKYNAIKLDFERPWDGDWALQGSYVWSQSYGNNEGFVRSDNGQDDAGLTTLFDQPGLLDGAYGYLPNDRRHTLKLFGRFGLADEWQLSYNFLWQSGRPVNAFGVHPTDAFAAAYGAESFYENGQLVPRGSRGRTPSIRELDLGLQYRPHWGEEYALTFRMDMFNAWTTEANREVVETAETDSGNPNPNYLTPTAYQSPRSVRLGFSVNF
ncbi:TonB-dependent receptor [Kangiella taiwanensis]|uniref:TonB-dependent receptor n=1 Tax=Kangiella taiwanensis TaxID=1079179 RepID=A0ABP8I0S0_9GAMM|nr:TonB-dependent receptor [Kangiella taiwanensis]